MVKVFCSYCGKEINKPQSLINKHNFCNKNCYHMFTRCKNNIFYENDYAYIIISKNNIPLKILFDIVDVGKISKYKWHLHYNKKCDRYDACTNTHGSHNDRKYLYMARYILDYYGELTIDHINHNTLDNRRKNLRIVTNFENQQNKTNNISGCVGVSWDKDRNKWRVVINDKYVGRYDTFNEAILARKNAEKIYQSQHNI